MTKSEYMKTLAYSLRRLPKEDFDQAMDYFEEYFAEAGPENEQKAIEDLGSPEEASKELIMNLAEKNAEKPPETVKHGFKAVWIGILGICAAPIALPLAFCLLLVIGALFFCLLCAVGGVLLTLVCALATAVMGFVGGIALMFTSFADGLATLGISLLFAGVGILAVYLVFLLCRWLLQKTAQFLGKLTKGGRKHEKNN